MNHPTPLSIYSIHYSLLFDDIGSFWMGSAEGRPSCFQWHELGLPLATHQKRPTALPTLLGRTPGSCDRVFVTLFDTVFLSPPQFSGSIGWKLIWRGGGMEERGRLCSHLPTRAWFFWDYIVSALFLVLQNCFLVSWTGCFLHICNLINLLFLLNAWVKRKPSLSLLITWTSLLPLTIKREGMLLTCLSHQWTLQTIIRSYWPLLTRWEWTDKPNL